MKESTALVFRILPLPSSQVSYRGCYYQLHYRSGELPLLFRGIKSYPASDSQVTVLLCLLEGSNKKASARVALLLPSIFMPLAKYTLPLGQVQY